MQPTRFFWMDLSVRNRYTEKHLWEGRSRIFWSQSTGHMANRTIFPASAGAEMQDLQSGFEVGHMCRSGEESRAAEYVKKVSETQVEQRVAYEVSVSKIEFLE